MQKRRTVSLNYKVCACTVKNSELNDLDENSACTIHCISTAIIWSKRCALLNGYFHSLQLSSFLSTTVAECLQCSVWILFNELHLPTNHKTVKTEHTQYKQTHYAELSEKDPLCSSFARAHLLSAWDIVAATVGLCIHG